MRQLLTPPTFVGKEKTPRDRLTLVIRRLVGRLPFRVVLAVPLASLLVIATGLTGYLAFQNGQRAVNDLANQLHQQAAARLHEHLDSYLATPVFINQLNLDAIRLGQLDVNDPQAMERHFFTQIQRFGSVISLAYASQQREYVGTYRKVLGVDLGVAVASKENGYTLEAYSVTPQGSRQLLDSAPDYDPRSRPWYQAAVQAGHPTWTPVFMWSSGDLGLDAVVPVYDVDNSLLGVLDTSLTLNAIGDFLDGLRVSENGETFIVEKSGLLVASSTIREPFIRNGNEVQQLSALESGDPLVQIATQSLEQQFGALANISSERTFDFDISGKRQYAEVTPYEGDYGFDWLIVTVIPESDIMAPINAGNRQTVLLILLSLLASITLAAFLSIGITRPIMQLNQSAKALAQGDWTQKVAVNREDEIGELSASFNRMAEQLQLSFASLRASEVRYRGLFEESPVSLWEEDASALKSHLDGLRESGIADWRAYFENHPEAVRACAAMIKIVNVNRATLEMFKAADKAPLLAGLPRFFAETSYAVFCEELIALAEGRFDFEAESVRQTLHGDEIYVNLKSSIVPGQAGAWSKVLVSLTDITKRKRAEMALQKSEETFSKAFRSSPAALAISRMGGNQHLIEVNEAFERLSGYRRDEIIGHTTMELGLWADPNDRERVVQLLIAEGSAHDLEYDFRSKNGWRISCRISAEMIDLGGEQCVLTVAVDLTERRRAEAALRESEERSRTLAAAAFEGIAITENGMVLDTNDQLTMMLGCDRVELIGQPVMNFVAPESRERVMAAIRSGSQEPYEHLALRKDGTAFPVDIRGRPMEVGGRQLRVTAILDITERKRAEQEIAEWQQRYELVAAASGQIVYERNFADGSICWGGSVEKVIGYQPSEMDGGRGQWEELIDPRDRAPTLRLLDAAEKNGTPLEVEYGFSHKDGRYVQMLDRGFVMPNPTGKPERMIGILQDITVRKQAEEELRKLSRAVEQSPVSIVITDPDGRIEYVNPRFVEITGYAVEEAIGQNPRILKSGYTPTEEYTRLWEAIKSGGEWRGEFCNKKKNGDLYWESAAISALSDSSGTITHFVAVKEDITERKQRERELEAIAGVSAALRAAPTRDAMLPIILDQLLELFKVDGAALAMLDPSTGEAVIELGREGWAAWKGVRLPMGEGVNGRVIATRRPYVNNDMRSDPLFARPDLLAGSNAVACVPLMVEERAIGTLWVGRGRAQGPALYLEITSEELRLLTAIADMAANAIHRATLHEQTRRYAADLALAYDTTIEGWSRALDLRDKETEGHTLRVTEMALRLAHAMGVFGEEQLLHIRRGALLHDIGKMGIPDPILLKPGPLTDEEWVIMRKHPGYAYDLLSPIVYLHPALDIPYCHHEKWDGTGYPRQLKGEAIPFSARIFAVVDVWDALRSDRPYRPAWPEEKVREHIQSLAGTHFDPKVIEAFFSMSNDT